VRPCDKSSELGLGMEAAKRRFGQPATARSDAECFHCPRCGYARPLKRGEDGFRIYILHEQRCNPAVGGQIWLPFITEDDLVWPPATEKRAALLNSRHQPQVNREREGSTQGTAGPHFRQAA